MDFVGEGVFVEDRERAHCFFPISAGTPQSVVMFRRASRINFETALAEGKYPSA